MANSDQVDFYIDRRTGEPLMLQKVDKDGVKLFGANTWASHKYSVSQFDELVAGGQIEKARYMMVYFNESKKYFAATNLKDILSETKRLTAAPLQPAANANAYVLDLLNNKIVASGPELPGLLQELKKKINVQNSFFPLPINLTAVLQKFSIKKADADRPVNNQSKGRGA
jgi:hypothetical protein